ncbi:MAG TPA: hypothetical protein ENK68_01080 [Epsilonproteobacteria bacterium]|nr:hypothetical protein [Campylobacterota bacterium]
MSEQAKILAQMQTLVMDILRTGSASEEDEKQLDTFEALLEEQICFQPTPEGKYQSIGDEIAHLFFAKSDDEALRKMQAHSIDIEDFFGFAEYFYDEGEAEELVETIFTPNFKVQMAQRYQEMQK